MNNHLYPLASCPLDNYLSSGQLYPVDNYIQYFEQPGQVIIWLIGWLIKCRLTSSKQYSIYMTRICDEKNMSNNKSRK